MESNKVPIPIVWSHEGTEIYVTGDFSNYSLTLLTGEKEKFCVVWCNPGTSLYRFLVDGSYKCDESKPTVMSEGVLYNFIEVAELPQSISNLHQLTLEELEKLDLQLFENTQKELERRIHKVKAFLLMKITRKKYLAQCAAAVKIQRFLKSKFQRKRFLNYLKYLRLRNCRIVDACVQTEPFEDLEKENEKLNKKLQEILDENEKLQKLLDDSKIKGEVKKKAIMRKVEPPLISIKAFMTPSKPLSFRDQKPEMTPKSKNSFVKSFKK